MYIDQMDLAYFIKMIHVMAILGAYFNNMDIHFIARMNKTEIETLDKGILLAFEQGPY